MYGVEWSIQDGWLTGKQPENAPGMIVLKGDFPGNVLVEFEARTVLPSTHDIDFMWNGSWVDRMIEKAKQKWSDFMKKEVKPVVSDDQLKEIEKWKRTAIKILSK